VAATNSPSPLMTKSNRTIQFAVWGGLGIVIATIVVAFALSELNAKPLPVYNEVPQFTLTDQNGSKVSLDSLRGQIWLADVIFTRCPLQCLRMSAHMKELQGKLPHDVKLVSLTTDPTYDTPAVLKKYSKDLTQSDNWLFLTGDKRVINTVAVNGLKLAVQETPVNERENPNDLFIHSTRFVLVDRQGRVRGFFDGDKPESTSEILSAVRTLKREKS
jgi:cytochrome oxidase Cu insertion factor (SCO1/SenC/PrrC family)